MANNKVYSNYLMHGRTKGSRNGISTTKGYRAVGHKARGRLSPDGRYIYDMSTHKKYVADGMGQTGMGSYHTYELNTKNAKKNGIDVNFAQKTVNSLNKGAANPWQQKANAAQYNDLSKDAARYDPRRNTWQQQAKAAEFRTRNVDYYDPSTDSYQSMDRNKAKEFGEAIVRKMEGTLPNTLGGATNQSSTKGTVTKPKGSQNNWQQMANKSAAAGIRNATVTTNAANAKKKAYQDSLSKGAQNNWQQMASKSAAAGERNNRVNNTAANKTKKSVANAITKGTSMNTAQQVAKAQAKAEAKKRWEEGAKAKAKAKAKADWKERRKKLKYK